MKNKILIALFTILTFGIFLIPCSFAKNFYSETLNNTNRVSYINKQYFNSANNYSFDIYFNTDNLDTSVNYYICLQVYDINNLTYPYNSSSMFLSVSLTGVTLSYNSTYYCYRSSSSYNLTTYSGKYIRCRLPGALTNYSDFFNNYVFQVQLMRSTTNCCNAFVPNTYYNIDTTNDLGYFNYTTVKLAQEGVGSSEWADKTQDYITYNRLALNQDAYNIYNNNRVNGNNMYYLQVNFDSAFIRDLPNFNIKYLELWTITVNGTYYTYDNAKNQFDWLYPNIYMYSSNATLFVNSADNVNNYTTYIDRIVFKIPDYGFTQSSYYSSSYGLENYIKNCCMTTLDSNAWASYERGFASGSESGWSEGYQDGYNNAVANNTTGFDSLMFSIADVPMKIISSILNFEILGFNLLGFFMGIITLMLFIHLMRKFRE